MFAPFGNLSANHTLPWRPEPNHRGTFGLLSSCLVTMTLCVWTAAHLNIPAHRKASQQTWRKVRWLIMGIFALEMVAWTAFHQRSEGSKICQSINDTFGLSPPPSSFQNWVIWVRQLFRNRATENKKAREDSLSAEPPSTSGPPKRHVWTMAHGHYAVMGGYAVDTARVPQNIFPGNRTRLTLTVAGLRVLTEKKPDHLPDLSKEEITDKSKANGLAKIIVCI
ncbi:hypothetical protein AOQ84DRAFT_390758 [Glonium stellatum]|uniref:Uncharacterized protein n=1 Tax=Glonium stellatum TaxID=574774 RepID=A0A8E2EVM8_9PEZI|nr:hypothetical protein AOQ84DRAFT_390758 [Glonium stellatum]